METNHKDGCDRLAFVYSGEGYNTVKVCACGAEDHAPTTGKKYEHDETLHVAPKWEISLRVQPIKRTYPRRHC